MANMTLAQLDAAIRTEMQLDPGLISTAERLRFINDCISDLGSTACFEKQATLAFTDGVATVPADFVDFIALLLDGTPLHPATTQYSTNGFIPRYPLIEIRPAVTDDLTLWYAYTPAPLAVDADIPDVPAGFDSAIVDYAVARAHRKNGNIGLYREYMAAYESKKSMLIERLTKLSNSRISSVVNTEEASQASESLFNFY